MQMKQNISVANYGNRNNAKKVEWLNDIKMNYKELRKVYWLKYIWIHKR